MSIQNAAGWGYFNACLEEWNSDILQEAGFPTDLLPHVVKSGAIAGTLDRPWYGIPSGTPVGNVIIIILVAVLLIVTVAAVVPALEVVAVSAAAAAAASIILKIVVRTVIIVALYCISSSSSRSTTFVNNAVRQSISGSIRFIIVTG